MTTDVVVWREGPEGCSRCGTTNAPYFVPPYYAPDKRLCTTCCLELNRLFDEHGWPQTGRMDYPRSR